MNSKGQTLVEVLVALSAGLIILTAISMIVITSLSQAVSSSSETQATQYAQEGMEILRTSTIPSTDGIYCFGTLAAGECPESTKGIFKREAIISSSDCGTGLKSVTVRVRWNDAKCQQAYCREVPITSCLTSL